MHHLTLCTNFLLSDVQHTACRFPKHVTMVWGSWHDEPLTTVFCLWWVALKIITEIMPCSQENQRETCAGNKPRTTAHWLRSGNCASIRPCSFVFAFPDSGFFCFLRKYGLQSSHSLPKQRLEAAHMSPQATDLENTGFSIRRSIYFRHYHYLNQ